MASSKGLRILCLHGRNQNAQSFAKKLFAADSTAACAFGTGEVVVAKGPHEFIFINGAHQTTPDIPARFTTRKATAVSSARPAPPPPRCDLYSWWLDGDKNPAAALETLAKRLEVSEGENQRIDGVLGFSQGGALAALVATKGIPRQGNRQPWRPQFGVLFSAYSLGELDASASGNLESFHAWGGRDQVVDSSKSENLCASLRGFADPIAGAGHATPTPLWIEEHLLPWLNAKASLRLSSRAPSAVGSASAL